MSREEFKLTEEEYQKILDINKEGGDPVMYLSGGIPLGRSLQEKINDYWKILGLKYGFKPMGITPSNKGKLYLIAEKI